MTTKNFFMVLVLGIMTMTQLCSCAATKINGYDYNTYVTRTRQPRAYYAPVVDRFTAERYEFTNGWILQRVSPDTWQILTRQQNRVQPWGTQADFNIYAALDRARAKGEFRLAEKDYEVGYFMGNIREGKFVYEVQLVHPASGALVDHFQININGLIFRDAPETCFFYPEEKFCFFTGKWYLCR